MAVRFVEATDRISYTGVDVPDPATGVTVAGWSYISVDTDQFATFLRVWDGGTAATIATGGDGLSGPGYFTGGGSITASTGNAVGEWRSWAITCTGTSGALYVAEPDGATEAVTGTVAGSSSPTGITIGGRSTGDASEPLNGRAAYHRVWAAELSQAEIEAEWASATPVRTAGLWADWPLEVHTDLTDHSGNGRDLTAGSTSTTTEDGPPVEQEEAGGTVLRVKELTAAVVSHVASLGVFEGVNTGEPRHMVGRGLRCALWVDQIQPVGEASGLASVTVRLALTVRIYGNLQAEPSDEIDPEILAAVDAVCNSFAGSFTFDGEARNVDLFGAHGQGMRGQAGYLELQEGVCRVVTITLPLIINDVWELVA